LEAGESRLPTADLTTADLSVDAMRASRLRFAEHLSMRREVGEFGAFSTARAGMEGFRHNVMPAILRRRSAP
jgi:hypothetical protein